MASTSNSAERTAFNHIKKLIHNPTVFASPRGSDQGFPDFGISFKDNNVVVDLHFEFKMDNRSPMGSSRRWKFDGESFSVPDATREEELVLMEVMNNNPTTVINAHNMIDKLQKYFDENVDQISTSTFTIVKDKKERQEKITNFKNKAGVLTLQKGGFDPSIGPSIIQRYKRKFAAAIRPRAQYSVLFFIIGNHMWFVDEHGHLDFDNKKMIARMFGAEEIPALREDDLRAQLEVRISPRPVDGKLDVNASSRLISTPNTKGLQIF